MKIISFLITNVFLVGFLQAQEPTAQQQRSLEKEFDQLVVEWEKLSDELKTYSGLETYCTNDQYKANVVNMLSLIHHYDSLVLDIITDPSEMAKLDAKEQKKTKDEIEKFESEYSTTAFIIKLKDECKFRKEIERNKEESKNDFGMNSYDGQILVLETDLQKYVKHIDSRLEHIDDHVHKLHIDNVREFEPINER